MFDHYSSLAPKHHLAIPLTNNDTVHVHMSHCLANVSGQQRILDPISMINFDVCSRIVHKYLAFAQPLDTFYCAVHFFLVAHILAQPWCLNCFGLVLGSDEPQSGRLE